MAYFKFFDTWNLADARWVAYSGHASNVGNTLVMDSSVDGPVTMLPMYTHVGYNQTDTLLVYKHDVTLSGTLRINFSTSSYQSAQVPAHLVLSHEAGNTRFSASPTTLPGWDGSIVVPGNQFQLRIATTLTRARSFPIQYLALATRIIVCDVGGTPIPGLDTGWLDGTWFSQLPSPVAGWSDYNYSSNSVALYVGYTAVSGSATFGPQTCYGNCSQAEAETFLASGDLAYSTVADPVISVTPVSGNAYRVEITADAGAAVWLTIDDVANKEGVFGSKNRFLYSVPFNIQGPAHIRAGACAEGSLESNTVSAWIGTAGADVMPPEITPPSCNFDALGSPIEVRIGHTQPSAVIRYTIDGSTPTISSPIYTNQILLRATAKVKAIAFNGSVASPVASQMYTDAPVVTTVATTDINAFAVAGNAAVGALVPGSPDMPAGLDVTDPTGLGVYLAEKTYAAAVYARVWGPFKYKVPGTSVYFMRAPGDLVGVGSDADQSGLVALAGSDAYIDLLIHLGPVAYTNETTYTLAFRVTGNVTTTPITGNYPYATAVDGLGNADNYSRRFIDILPCFAGYDGTPFRITDLQYVDTYLDRPSRMLGTELDPFLTAQVPLAVSTAPVVTPASGDLSSSDITITAPDATVCTTGKLTGSLVSVTTTIPGFLEPYDPRNPLALRTTAVETGKLRSSAVDSTYTRTAGGTWFLDVLPTFENWDVKRSYSNWTMNSEEPGVLLVGPDSYDLNYGFSMHDEFFSGDLISGDDGRFQRAWDSFELTWNNTRFDGASVWMRAAFNLDCSNDLRMLFGFNVPSTTYQVGFQLVRNRGALASNDTHGSSWSHALQVGVTRPSDWTWLKQPTSIWSSSTEQGYRKLFLNWGRRVSDGAVRLQVLHAVFNYVVFDSGWLTASAQSARPYIRIETRRGWTGGQPRLTPLFVDGHFGITNQQLDTLFVSSTPEGVPAPIIGQAQPGSAPGTVSFPITIADGASLSVSYGGAEACWPINDRLPGSTLPMFETAYAPLGGGALVYATRDLPSHTTIQAQALRSVPGRGEIGYDTNVERVVTSPRSASVTASSQRTTAEFLSVSAVRAGEVEIWADTSVFYSQLYLLHFDDGTEYPFTFDTRAFRKTFGPGEHWVRLVSANNRTSVETIPLVFTVPADGALTTSVPSSFNVSSAATFQASAVGSTEQWSYKWVFSDGQTIPSASAVVTFARPGHYTWTVYANDGAESTLFDTGSFVVPVNAVDAPATLLLKSETRIS